MNYFEVSSLRERASYEVALNIFQIEEFKKVSLNLDKPTDGSVLKSSCPFIEIYEDISRSVDSIDFKKVKYWEDKVVAQCQKQTEEVPHFLKVDVQPWIMHIALEYLSYCRRQELLFSVPRRFMLNFVTRNDWLSDGRLDEQRLAKRLIKNKKLSSVQRYRIACVYCLSEHIPALFKKLTDSERDLIQKKDYCYKSCKTLIDVWTDECYNNSNEAITMQKDNDFWNIVMVELVRHGNKSVLVPLWRKLDEEFQQNIIFELALRSLQKWQNVYNQSTWYFLLTKRLAFNELPLNIDRFNLPSHYNHLIFFFLSEMDKKQQLDFFREAFKMSASISRFTYPLPVLECLLDWPFQENFLKTINQLWKIIPKDLYKRCFITLASKYSGTYWLNYDYDYITGILDRGICSYDDSLMIYENENRYYDYQSLLWELWDETPQDYKQYLLSISKDCNFMFCEGLNILYPQLLDKSPFLETDEAFFKRIICNLSDEEKLALINSKTGKLIRFLLAAKEKWLLSDWLLQQCLPKEKIPCYKKQFIRSSTGRKLCFYHFKMNNQKFLRNFIDWSFSWNSQKRIYKTKLICGGKSVIECADYLYQGEFTKVESLIKFCLSSDVKKSLLMKDVAYHTCFCIYIYECKLDHMDRILAWCFGTPEKIQEFKNFLFAHIGANMFLKRLFMATDLRSVEYFYEWFGLSPEQIKNLKKDSFEFVNFHHIVEDVLYDDKINVAFEAPLSWFLTDEELVLCFKKYCENLLAEEYVTEKVTLAQERLNNLVNKLLLHLKEKAPNNTSKEIDSLKDNPKKRSAENESEPPNKRLK